MSAFEIVLFVTIVAAVMSDDDRGYHLVEGIAKIMGFLGFAVFAIGFAYFLVTEFSLDGLLAWLNRNGAWMIALALSYLYGAALVRIKKKRATNDRY